MFGTISEEIEVNVGASEAWELYGSLKLAKLIGEELTNVIDKVEVIEGDGGVGTILELTFPPGMPSYKEKFTKVDHEKRVKETEVIEGGYLDLGFTLFRARFEVIEKSQDSCITKSTIEYQVKEEAAASMVSIQPLVKIMEVSANYLIKKKQIN